jgi:hypothetical protein
VTDTVRVLVTAAALVLAALGTFSWHVRRLDPSHAERLVGELRLGQWAAIVLAAVGALPIGLAFAQSAGALSHLDVALGVLFVGVSGLVLQRDPREALLILAAAFIAHALLDIAHRPGGLTPELAPRGFVAASATFDVCVAAVCYWGRRR